MFLFQYKAYEANKIYMHKVNEFYFLWKAINRKEMSYSYEENN